MGVLFFSRRLLLYRLYALHPRQAMVLRRWAWNGAKLYGAVAPGVILSAVPGFRSHPARQTRWARNRGARHGPQGPDIGDCFDHVCRGIAVASSQTRRRGEGNE
jgi:hypothetical protein